MERFSLSEAQAQAIVDMRLKALTGLEREKLEQEHAELLKKIEEYKAILGDEKILLGVIRTEILAIAEKFGDERKSKIEFSEADIDLEDLVPNKQTIIALTSLGYIKRMGVENFKAQNRGGKGIKGISTIENDYVEDLLMTKTHNLLLFFTSFGRVYSLKAYKIPEGSRTSRGVAIVNLLQLNPGEKITSIIPVKSLEHDAGKCLFMVTKNGTVKKTPVEAFANIRKTGLNAIILREGDELIEVKATDKDSEIFIVTKFGMSIHFRESDVRSMGRMSSGVRGMMLLPEDEVVGMQTNAQGPSLLIVSEKGYGKRTALEEFRMQNRGGKGIKCYKITDKTGNVSGVKAVDDGQEIMMITSIGTLIQLRIDDINTYSRITSGVKMIGLEEGVTVAKVAKVRSDADFIPEDTDDEETKQSEENTEKNSEG